MTLILYASLAPFGGASEEGPVTFRMSEVNLFTERSWSLSKLDSGKFSKSFQNKSRACSMDLRSNCSSARSTRCKESPGSSLYLGCQSLCLCSLDPEGKWFQFLFH